MKQIATLIFLTAISLVSLAQSNSFNYNQAQFNFDNDGSFFSTKSNGIYQTGYFPEASQVPGMKYVGFMMGGKHQDTNIHMVYSKYGVKSLSPGPIVSDYNNVIYQDRFSESVWFVSKNQVENHKLHFWDQFYQIPDAILNWPGNGNVSNGESANLAPFEDVNNNGLYEPLLGDYPCIKGDQCAYIIMNDQRIDSSNVPMGIEVHLMFYQFLWPDIINQTSFVNAKIFNRSTKDYTDLKTGFFVSFQLGDLRNDYFGTDTTRELFYSMNATTFDSTHVFPTHTQYGFGENAPALGIKVLNDELYATNYAYDPFDNSIPGSVNDPNVIENYTYMSGLFDSNQHLTYGEFGTNPNNVETNYLYSGYRNSGWTEAMELHAPGPRRGMMSIAKDEFLADEVIEYDFAVVYGRPENPDDIWDAVDVMFENADIVQEFYDNMDQSCQNETADVSEFKELEFQVYPNPANDEVFVQLNGSFQVEVYNVFGKQVIQKSKGFQQEKIDLSHCAAGVYFVKVIQDGHSSIKKLILK